MNNNPANSLQPETIVEKPKHSVHVYGMPQCKTTQRALEFLQEIKVEVKSFRNVKFEKLSEKEIRQLADLAGSVEAIFSRRAIQYRALDLDKITLTDDDKVMHMLNEHTFIRRPLIVTEDGRLYAGFHERKLREFFFGPIETLKAVRTRVQTPAAV